MVFLSASPNHRDFDGAVISVGEKTRSEGYARARGPRTKMEEERSYDGGSCAVFSAEFHYANEIGSCGSITRLEGAETVSRAGIGMVLTAD